jgi:hypothetical protein
MVVFDGITKLASGSGGFELSGVGIVGSGGGSPISSLTPVSGITIEIDSEVVYFTVALPELEGLTMRPSPLKAPFKASENWFTVGAEATFFVFLPDDFLITTERICEP